MQAACCPRAAPFRRPTRTATTRPRRKVVTMLPTRTTKRWDARRARAPAVHRLARHCRMLVRVCSLRCASLFVFYFNFHLALFLAPPASLIAPTATRLARRRRARHANPPTTLVIWLCAHAPCALHHCVGRAATPPGTAACASLHLAHVFCRPSCSPFASHISLDHCVQSEPSPRQRTRQLALGRL